MRLPSGAVEVLPSPSPIKGTVEAATAAASFAGDAVKDSKNYKAAVTRAGRGVAQGRSVALSRLHAKLSGSLEPGAQLLIESAFSAKNGFSSYAAEIERIHRAARVVRQQVHDHLAAIRVNAAIIEEILSALVLRMGLVWNSPPSPAMPVPVLDESRAAGLDAAEREAALREITRHYEAQWRNAATAWNAACDGIGGEKRRWNTLIEERRQCEAALLRTLRETHLGTLMQVGATAGISAKQMVAFGFAGEVWGGRGGGAAAALPELFSGGKSPDEVARAWQKLKATGADTDALLRWYCFELANLDGLPFEDMDKAGRAALEYALDVKHPAQLEEAYFRMGFRPGERRLEEFRKDLGAVRDALKDAAFYALGDDTVQLVSLGRHDGAATAGISLGNLDTAPTVGVFVSGMQSDVHGIKDAFKALAAVRDADADMAMVTWVGYHSPSLVEEAFQDRADAGGLVLASFLDGIAAQRAANPIDRFAVLAHSYGTNVVAEALKITAAPVEVFVTIGSAGLQYGTTAEQLGVSEIHATHAIRDNIAQSAGRHVHVRYSAGDGGGVYEARVDPRDLEGAREFSSEQTPGGKQVTMHNLLNPIDWGDMLPAGGEQAQWLADWADGTPAAEEIGYLHPRSSTVGGLYDIMRGVQ